MGPLWLLHCSPETRENAAVAPAVPLADRESWEVNFTLREKDLLVGIRAPYMQDQGRFTYADSARIEFSAPAGEPYSSLSATRLTLDGAERIGMGGEVVITAGDSLKVLTDTLVWERNGKRLHLPGSVRILTLSGTEEGQNLQTDIDFVQWSMEATVGRWRGRREGQAYEVEIRAQRAASSRREGYLSVCYDSVIVAHQGTTIRSPRARFDEAAGTMYFSDGVSSVDSARQFSAREMDYQLDKHRAVARKEVILRQADWRLEADQLIEDGERKHLQARGQPAVFHQGARSITASELDYDEREENLEASGQVVFREGERLLRSAHLVYQQKREYLEASGAISLQTPELEGVLHSGRMIYDLKAARMDLRETPQLRRQRPDGVLLIHADEMHLDLEQEQLAGEGAFRLVSPGLDLRAMRGLYNADEERLILALEVVLTQGEEENHRRQIQADSMIVHLREGEVEQIHIPSQMQGSVRSSETRRSNIQGAESRLFFQGEDLERVELEGGAEVIHEHLDENAVSRIQGENMSLHFAAQRGLQRIQVQGQAKFSSQLPPEEEDQLPSINQVEGEELEIFLEDGSIVEVKVIKPKGNYYPPREKQ